MCFTSVDADAGGHKLDMYTAEWTVIPVWTGHTDMVQGRHDYGGQAVKGSSRQHGGGSWEKTRDNLHMNGCNNQEDAT